MTGTVVVTSAFTTGSSAVAVATAPQPLRPTMAATPTPTSTCAAAGDGRPGSGGGRIGDGVEAMVGTGRVRRARCRSGDQRSWRLAQPRNLSAGGLKYLFVTHQETPHCGGLGRVLKTFPIRYCAAT